MTPITKITNNAGGYGFYQSGARGRFMRLRFNRVPMDQPGRYFYLRDRESGEYWSASWQPVGKPYREVGQPNQREPKTVSPGSRERCASTLARPRLTFCSLWQIGICLGLEIWIWL